MQKRSAFCGLLYCAVWLLALPVVLRAQENVTLKGKVSDAAGKAPLIGVTVSLKGTNTGTSTEPDGSFSVQVPSLKGTLVFSAVGYANKEVAINNQRTFTVELASSSAGLDEVVVVGYGTQRKKDLTGAVAQIKVSQLENENPNTVTDILRGNVAGLNISQINAGSAKGGGDLLVRGKSSINAGTTPLIVLDGVIYPGQLSDINPNDIATVDVLKDASSAAVYGAKAASGVIIITTKKGASGKAVININSNVGYGELAKNQPLYDGPGFVAWRTDVQKSRFRNAEPYRFDDPSTLPPDISIDDWLAYDASEGDPLEVWLTRLNMKPIEIDNYKAGRTVDWYDQVFQKGFRQDHTASVSGRNDDVNYYLSLGYTDNEGIIVGDRFKTVRLRLNLEGKIAKFLTVGTNLQFADRDESQVPVNWGQMVNASPYGQIYNDDGTLRDSPNDDLGNVSNPFADNYYTNRLQKYNTLFGTLYAKGELPFGFSYQVNFTPNFEFRKYFNGISADHPSYRSRKGFAERLNYSQYYWQIDNILKWDKSFGEHQFNVTLLANMEKFQSWETEVENEGFDPSDVLSYHNIGAGIRPIVRSNDEVSTGDALMARLNYTFKDRYLLTVSMRRDGYSAFGQLNPWGYFPSAALGWVFTDEKFMGSSASWLNYGKLRISYGINGNRDIGRYRALSDLTTGKYQYVSPSGTVIPVSQLWVNRMQNDNLRWERTQSGNIGVDLTTLNSRLSGSIDVYQKWTNGLLILRSLPTVTGFDEIMFNLGGIQNRGIEVLVNSTNIEGRNFSWRTSANFWLNRNKITKLYGMVNVLDENGKVIGQEERDDEANRWFIGRDIESVWDQRVLGVWQESEATEAARYGVFPGDFKVQDVNNDGLYSNEDRQFLGFSSPRFQWTLRNEFSFLKNFDFSFMLYSNWGQMASYNQAKNNSGFQDRQNSYVLQYWTPEHPTNDYARLYSSNGSASFSVYRKTSFIRLNTVALAYSLPVAMLERAGFRSVKIYANVTNAAIYAPDWEFWDPEFRNRDGNGNISTAIPPRYYTLGVNVSL